MGPIEYALRGAPSFDNQDLYSWLWGDPPYGDWSHLHLTQEAFAHVSETVVQFGTGRNKARMKPGFCISYCADRGLLPDLLSEAVEAAEALGL
jgi:hypothetical protein